jgi:hypothetical protein
VLAVQDWAVLVVAVEITQVLPVAEAVGATLLAVQLILECMAALVVQVAAAVEAESTTILPEQVATAVSLFIIRMEK